MTTRSELVRQIEDRANGRCEYCKMHHALQGATFHVEHVIPLSHGGASTMENLALACPSCNLRKSDRIRIPIPNDYGDCDLYNPRRDIWSDHFEWHGWRLVGRTVVGLATIEALDLNSERRQKIRHAEAYFDLFPPA